MFFELEKINSRPEPFQFYTAEELWTDEYTSQQMLTFHLNEQVDVSSRKADFIDQSVKWMASEFNISPDSRVADFGCGPGLYAIRLARLGAHVTGIDFSERSIMYAKEAAVRESLSIRYVRQNYLEFETEEQFDLVIMIMCDFCALSPSQRQVMLKKFRNIIKPGGSILLDVYSMRVFDAKEEIAVVEKNMLGGFWSSEPYYGFLNTFKYEKEKVVLDKFTIVESDRTRTIYNWLQHFSLESLAKEFEKAGLSIKSVYRDVAGGVFKEAYSEFAVVVTGN